MTTQSLTVAVTGTDVRRRNRPKTFSLNNARRSMHWRAEAAEAKALKAETKRKIAAAHYMPPFVAGVEIFARMEQGKRGQLPDADAISLAVKSVIDGIVAAGVLPDDSPEYLDSVTFLSPTRSDDGTRRIVVTVRATNETAGAIA